MFEDQGQGRIRYREDDFIADMGRSPMSVLD